MGARCREMTRLCGFWRLILQRIAWLVPTLCSGLVAVVFFISRVIRPTRLELAAENGVARA